MAPQFKCWVILIILLSSSTAIAAPLIRTVALRNQQAPGLPDGVNFAGGFTDEPLIDAAGRVLFTAQLSGSGFKPFENNSLWMYDAGSYSLVARGGSQPPGMSSGVNFTTFGSLALSSTGNIAFGGNLTGTGVDSSNRWGHWSGTAADLHLVFRGGDAAPGVAGSLTFSQVDRIQVSATGQTAFFAYLKDPSTSARTGSIWTENAGVLTLVAHQGDRAAGMPDGVAYGTLDHPGINAAGNVAFKGSLVGTASVNDSAIWSNATGPLAPVVRKGDHAPGTPAGVNFKGIGTAGAITINGTGQIAFEGILSGPGVDDTNNESIYRGTTGALSLIARDGDHAPGLPAGVVFSSLEFARRIDSAGNVQFKALLSGPGIGENNSGSLWLEDSGSLHLLARDGDHAPGTPAGVVFSSIQSDRILNPAGQVAFISYLSGPGVNISNDKGIWIVDKTGVPQLVVREGQQLEVANGDIRTISSFSTAHNGDNDDVWYSFFNAQGQVAFRASFTSGGSGIFVSDPTAVPEPTSIVMISVVASILSLRRD